MEIRTRKILYCHVTTHPIAEWTAQQFREAIPSDHSYPFLFHDRDSIFSKEVDQTLENLGLKVLQTPVRAPQANAYCERLIGTNAARMPGLHDSVQRTTAEKDFV
jgi:transposase InsO family protein